MKVQVTLEHLDKAIAAVDLGCQAGTCLIAQTLKEKFEAKSVACGWTSAYVDDKEVKIEGATKLINKFDHKEYNELRMELPAYIDVERV